MSDATATETPVIFSDSMKEVVSSARDVAETDTTVLLLGESGTGKELMARFIHGCSLRAEGPFVLLSCSGAQAERLERDLFGCQGDETPSSTVSLGKLEAAQGGTLVLDEVGELPMSVQATLARALQDRAVRRVGGEAFVHLNVRLVVTSSQNLRDLVASGRFRADLYYRLCVFPITIAPLRERTADIGALAAHFMQTLSVKMGRVPPVLSPEALAALGSHPYNGNVRELRNVVERTLIRCRQRVVQPVDVLLDPPMPARTPVPPAPHADDDERRWALPIDLGELERLAIGEALRRVGGNRTHAARLLGISLRTLRNKLRSWRQSEGEPTADEGDVAAASCQEHDTRMAQSSQRTSEEQAA